MLHRITKGVRNGLRLVWCFFTREQSESATNYVELNTPRQREQPQYEELDQRHTQRHNGRHQSNNYENAAAASAQ